MQNNYEESISLVPGGDKNDFKLEDQKVRLDQFSPIGRLKKCFYWKVNQNLK